MVNKNYNKTVGFKTFNELDKKVENAVEIGKPLEIYQNKSHFIRIAIQKELESFEIKIKQRGIKNDTNNWNE